LVSGLKHVDSIKLDVLPRMADAAIWITACEREIDLNGEFNISHSHNQLNAIESSIEASPVGTAILNLIGDDTRWIGTPTELYDKLECLSSPRQVKSKAWPHSPKGFSNAIKRLTPSFKRLGIRITKQKSGTMKYFIERMDF